MTRDEMLAQAEAIRNKALEAVWAQHAAAIDAADRTVSAQQDTVYVEYDRTIDAYDATQALHAARLCGHGDDRDQT